MKQGDTLSLEGINYQARYVNEVLIIDEFRDLKLVMQTLVPQTLDEFIIASMNDMHLSICIKQLNKELYKRGTHPMFEVKESLQRYKQHIHDSVSELQGMDCRSSERSSYYRGVQRGIEIALQELNKLQGE